MAPKPTPPEPPDTIPGCGGVEAVTFKPSRAAGRVHQPGSRTPNPAIDSVGAASRRNWWALLDVHGQRGGAGRPQGSVELRVEPRCLAQLGEERLLWRRQLPSQPGKGAAARGPDRGRRRRRGSVRRRPADRTGAATPRRRRRIGEPEAGAYVADGRVGLPLGQRVGKRGAARRVGGEPALEAGQRGQPCPGDRDTRPPTCSRDAAEPARAAASTRPSRARPRGRGRCRGPPQTVPAAADAASVRAQVASDAVSTGRHIARGASTLDAGQQPPPCDEIRREARELGDVRERRLPGTAPSVSGSLRHGEQEVSVEFERGQLPLAGRQLLRRQRRAGSRTSSGEAIGPAPRVGKVSVTVDAVAFRAAEGSTATRCSCAAANGCAWTRGLRPGLRGSAAGAEESSRPDPEPTGLGSATVRLQPGSQQAWTTNTYTPLRPVREDRVPACQPSMANPHHPRSISVPAGSQSDGVEHPRRLGHADGPRVSIIGPARTSSTR